MKIDDVEYVNRFDRGEITQLDAANDPLRAANILQESTLVGLRHDFIRARISLLVDCKGAIGIDGGNTAVIVLENVDSAQWRQDTERANTRQDFAIVGWTASQVDGALGLRVELTPSAKLFVTARVISVYIGDVPGADSPAPDYGSSHEPTLRKSIVNWNSEFSVREFSSLSAV